MSMRTLIELNHDYSDRLCSHEMQAFLKYYLASGSKRDAEALGRFGMKVIGMRHHSDKWIIDGAADGFPPSYLTTAQGMSPGTAEPGPERDAPDSPPAPAATQSPKGAGRGQ